MLANLKLKIIIGAILLLVIFGIALSISLVGGKREVQPSPSPSPQSTFNFQGNDPLSKLNRFKLNKYRLLPLLTPEATPTATLAESQDLKLPTPLSYSLGKAKITFLPLPDLFEGRVDQAKNLDEYRKEKKAILEDLKKQAINICDLNIYWVKPLTVKIQDLKVEDTKSDGC